MADEASANGGIVPGAQAAWEPTLQATRPAKVKVPPRRVYGDEFVVEVEVGRSPTGEPITQTFHPHAGEWMEYVGTMTIETYMRTLDQGRLRTRERELRELSKKIETRAGAELDEKDQAAVDALNAELAAITEEIRAAMEFTHAAVASLLHRGVWTNSRSEPLGTPTGETDPETGLPISTFSPADLGRFEMEDLGFLADHAYGDMKGSTRSKN